MASRRRLSNNQVAAIIGLAAGLLMLIAGFSGAAGWQRILEFVQEKLGTNEGVSILARILVTIASLGGILVLIGSALIYSDRVRAGRVAIWLGAGFGLIGLALFILIHLERQEIPFASGIGLGAIGVILSIVARVKSEIVTRGR